MEHLYRLFPSTPDLNDHLWTAPPGWRGGAHEGLGVTVPFRNQLREGSCGGFATTSAYAAARMRAGHPYREFSPAAAYWWARSFSGTDGQDAGTTIQDEMKALVKYGAAPEEEMPYVAGDFATPPSPQAAADAAGFAAAEYWRIGPVLADIKYAIHIGQPIVIGIAVYQSFEDANSQGAIPMPAPGEAMKGGHALWCHDMQDDASSEGGGAIIGDGSWGNTAPFALPYKYLTDTRLTFEVRTFALPTE